MTNRDALISEIQIASVSDNAIDKAIIDLNINADGVYNYSYREDIARAALMVLKGMVAIKSIQEGGFAITFQVEKRILDIQTEFGWLPPVVALKIPKVRALRVC